VKPPIYYRLAEEYRKDWQERARKRVAGTVLVMFSAALVLSALIQLAGVVLIALHP